MAGVLQKVLLVPTHSQVCAFSKKLQFGWLRLQFMAGYNWARKMPTLDYRVTTKWSDGGRLKRKERYRVAGSMLLRCKWNMDLHLPDMEGHLGANELDLEPVDIDYGRLDFEISQVDMVLESPLWRTRPSSAASAQSADQGGHTTRQSLPGAEADLEGSSKQVGRSDAEEGPSSSRSSVWRGAGEAQHPSLAGPRAWWQHLAILQIT
ncbi:hypothetical protein DUNSADRAFT_14939 [Dunaliella salina]|uniref:DUF7781 domain-containing protein n=1 Tax=Dunaliella salina TaxID=3046 RepID=A0ABQ7G6D1_DUNSA|nr:hypothetical protein DUNSADRAFT_14939 [Dunaliella salina]|eukprot:KAF5830162.1 hypothetical protein DUNSADRAFT_14939 [Dunaliella salina]